MFTRAVDVFQNLGRLRNLCAAHANDLLDHLPIQLRGYVAADAVDPTHQLGDGLGRMVLATRIFALGGIGEKKIPPAFQTGLLKDRQHHLAGGARIGAALQHDQLSRPKRCRC